jgi:hypothetical protein
MIYWTKNRQPHKWRDKIDLDIRDAIRQLDDEKLAALAKKASLKLSKAEKNEPTDQD